MASYHSFHRYSTASTSISTHELMTTQELPIPPLSLEQPTQPLKHSIESLLNPSKSLKLTPVRPTARYNPYSPPNPSLATTSGTSLSPLEKQLILLKQLQQKIQLSNYISTFPDGPGASLVNNSYIAPSSTKPSQGMAEV